MLELFDFAGYITSIRFLSLQVQLMGNFSLPLN